MEPPPEAKHGAEDAVCDLISDDEEQPKKAQKDEGAKPKAKKRGRGKKTSVTCFSLAPMQSAFPENVGRLFLVCIRFKGKY